MRMNQNDMVLLPVENVVMIADTSEKHTQEDFFFNRYDPLH